MFIGLFKKKYDRKAILFILLIAAAVFLRFYHLREYFIFMADEARDAFTMKDMWAGHIVLCGPTASVGDQIHLGPIFYYMLFPFFVLFNFDPASGAVMAALFAVATVAVLYLFLQELCGAAIAFAVSGLYVLSPLVVHYGRLATNPGPLPFFSTLFFYALYKARKGKDNFIFLAALCLGVMLQLHFTCIAFFAFFIAYFFYRKIPLFDKRTGYSLLILFVLFLPCIAYLFITGFKDVTALSGYLSTGGLLKNPTPFDGAVYWSGLGDRRNILVNFEKTLLFFGYFFRNIFFNEFGWLGLLAGAAILWRAIADIFIKPFDSDRKFAAGVLLLWIFLPLIGFTFCFKNFLRLHHLLFLFTAPFVGWAYLWHSFAADKACHRFFSACTVLMLLLGAYGCLGYFNNMEKGVIDRAFLSDQERAVKFIAGHAPVFDLAIYPKIYVDSYGYILLANNLQGRCRADGVKYAVYNIYPEDIKLFGEPTLKIEDFYKNFKSAASYRNAHIFTTR